MICEKDVEEGKAFWAAAVASRVILPNGEEAERKTCKVSGWYLLEKAGVLRDKAKHHYSKHDWQHVR